MTYYHFVPCNGVEPEGKEGDELSVMIHGSPRTIKKFYTGWAWQNKMPIGPWDWKYISILTPVEQGSGGGSGIGSAA